MTVLNVPYIRNNATGAIEPIKVLRDDVHNDGLDHEPLLMPRLSFGHASHEEPGPVVRQHATTPNDGSVVLNNGVDMNPLLMPRLDFSGRVNNGACGCKSKPAAVTNSNGYDTEPLVAPRLDFSNRR